MSSSFNPGVAASPALSCRGIAKVYEQGPQPVTVLSGIDLAVAAGERLAIVGRSGSGKSTLLNILGGLDQPSSGEVLVAANFFNRVMAAVVSSAGWLLVSRVFITGSTAAHLREESNGSTARR